ncbi:xanthine dehydrogenase, fad binding subunit [hydrocarbon metagenome]|uniref:Xanthine dehydrogenase, fad binding subunit n=1 Tax=hydrocarbon metagenome TaxID=938273 RepID=A0A0W8E1H0_9ZZZZ
MVKAYRPLSLTEALEIRESGDTVLLAGGSDLMVQNRRGSGIIPDLGGAVVFIAHLPELQGIFVAEDSIKIGAACTLAGLLQEPDMPEYVKAPLAQMASPAIRNTATIGGNICNSSPAGDTLPMLYALEARLLIQSSKHSYMVRVEDFITGPGQNLLQTDEILVQVQIPNRIYDGYYYKKVGARKANAISKLSFFAVSRQEDNRIQELRIALGSVAPTVVRSREAESLLAGLAWGEIAQVLPEVQAYYEDLIQPIDDVRSSQEYRHRVALGLLRNYLLTQL